MHLHTWSISPLETTFSRVGVLVSNKFFRCFVRVFVLLFRSFNYLILFIKVMICIRINFFSADFFEYYFIYIIQNVFIGDINLLSLKY